MKITFLGDVHAEWSSLHRVIEFNSNTDLFIQVGDFGIMPKIGLYPNNKGFLKPIMFIDGNHDDHDLLARRVRRSNLRISNDCWYIPRASHLRFDGITINCIGGAVSIDKQFRIPGKTWWEKEVPSYQEFGAFVALEPADVIVTHDVPHSICQLVMSHHSERNSVSNTLEHIWQMIDYKPKYWFFGHHHKPFDQVIKGTRFVCLGCVHEDEGQPGNTGFTIDTEEER